MTAIFGILATGLTIGVPIAFTLLLTGLVYMLSTGHYPTAFPAYLFGSLNSSSLLSIPFFILSAEILSRSGGTDRLIRFVDACLGHNRGGLPVVAVVATTFFAAICGSSAATAAAIGSVMVPKMFERGYDRRFAVGLIATAGGLGILLPPSVPLIIYGMVTETSISQLFAAATIPGLLLATCLGVAAYVIGRRSGVPPEPRQPMSVRLRAAWDAAGVLLMPILILGGIYSGITTATEAAACACVYALVLAMFYGSSMSEFLDVLTRSTAAAGMILLILGAATLFSYALTYERVPHLFLEWMTGIDLSPTALMLILMAFFIVCGMFLEVISIILIVMPILIPVLVAYDISLVHFAVLLIINMEIAVISPPIGLNLYIIAMTAKVPVHEVFRGTLPFLGVLLAFLAAMTFLPGAEFLTLNY